MNIEYETKFEDGRLIDNYHAVAYAEGFEEPDNSNDTVRAWSYLIGTRLAYSLQGWFGRTAQSIIENGAIDEYGKVNWDKVNE